MTRKNLAVVLVFCLLLVCFSACQSEQDEIYSQAVEDQKSAVSAAPTAEPGDGEASEMLQGEDSLAGELTIRVGVLRDMYRINSLAMEFMKLHPGVTITIDADYSIAQWDNMSSAEQRMHQESFRSQLRTEIASGEADYLIFDFTDELDLTPLSQVGALSDMSEFWENDPDLQEDDLFMPVIEAFQVEGKMTAVPYAFLLPTVTFSQHVIDDAGIDLTGVHTVGVTQLLDWYDQARELKPELNLIFTSWSKDTLFAYERPDYTDLANETCDFDSPEFVEFLERTKGVNAEDPDLGENELAMGDIGFAPYWEEYWETGEVPLELVYTDIDQFTNIATKAREWFCVPQHEIFLTSFTLQQPLERVTRPYALTSTEGKLVLDAWEVFAMPSSMKDKELGWEFIKYCLSTREEPTCGSELYTYGIPVNKENYRKAAEHVSTGGTYPDYSMGYPQSYPGLDPDATVEEMEAMLSVNTVYAGAYNVDVQEYLDEYYVNDLISAEECAKKIQDRTYMWLNE